LCRSGPLYSDTQKEVRGGVLSNIKGLGFLIVTEAGLWGLTDAQMTIISSHLGTPMATTEPNSKVRRKVVVEPSADTTVTPQADEAEEKAAAGKGKKATTAKSKAAAKKPAATTEKVAKVAKPKAPAKVLTPAEAKKKAAKEAKKIKAEAEAAEIEAILKTPRKKKIVPGSALVIVESPAKAKTIGKYLGSNYIVKASVGHVVDLPKSKIGVDVENNFEPEYMVMDGKKKVVADLRRAARDVDIVYLASDPDREGEAIAWHIANEISDLNTNVKRVLINEITKKGVMAAISDPTVLNSGKPDAQKARRILDRLAG